MTEQPWILAIDFGTSFTVAAVKVDGRNAEVVEISGERRMPSIVMIEDDGALVVGRVAENLAPTSPSRTLRAPKSRLGDQAPVVLGGRPYQIADLVAGLLRFVYTEVMRQMGGTPREVRLTHPASWNRPRLNRLLEAAAKAGLDNVSLVPEPVGAALFYANEIGVEAGSQVAVYDLGGGTFDSAVVTSTGSGFTIVGRPGGDPSIGGELFDEILFNHVGERLPADAWYEIQVGEDPEWQRAGAALRNEVRRAKEALSAHPYAALLVSLPDGLQQARVTIGEYEELIGPYVDETVTLLARTIENAGLTTEELEAVYLVGGASRAPIVERAVTARYPGVTVSRRGDPKTSVVLGAATAQQLNATPPLSTDRSTQDAPPATAPRPVLLGPPPDASRPGPATSASGGSVPPAAAGSLPPSSPAPPLVAAPSAGPPSGPPVGPPPPGPPPSRPPDVPSGSPSIHAFAATGDAPRRPPWWKQPWAAVVAVLAVLTLIGGAVVLLGGGEEGSTETSDTDLGAAPEDSAGPEDTGSTDDTETTTVATDAPTTVEFTLPTTAPPQTTTAAVPETAVPVPPPVVGAAPIGTSTMLQDGAETIEATVLAVADPAPTYDYSPPEPGNRAVAVQVRAVNTGSVPYMDHVYMAVVDSAGTSYETNFTSVALHGSFSLTRLLPGDTRVGWVVFELPEASPAVAFHWELDGLSFQGPGIWDLTAAAVAPSPTPPPLPATTPYSASVTITGESGQVDVAVVSITDNAPLFEADAPLDPGMRLVAIEIALFNSGTAVFSEAPSRLLNLIDANAQMYSPSFSNTALGSGFPDNVALQPGAQLIAFVTFELPVGEQPFKLQASLDFGLADQLEELALA